MTEYVIYSRDEIERLEIYKRLKSRIIEGFKWVIINTYTKKSRGYYKTKQIANNFLSLNKGEKPQLIIIEIKNIVVKINSL